MNDNLIYGVVVKNILYSNRIESSVQGVSNGIYSLDMSVDDFRSTLSIANILDAKKYFNKASTIKVIRGLSFHDGIIPLNPIAYKKIPLKIVDATYDEFEEVEVVSIRDNFYYYIQSVQTDKAYSLMDIKEAFESKKNINIDAMAGLSPEIRLLYTFHLIERKNKEMSEPVNFIKKIMSDTGADVGKIVKKNTGYEVTWSFRNNTINTLLDKDFRVIEAGFCVSGFDKTQSAKSVVNLLKDYQEEGSYIHLTRTVR